MPSVKSTSPSPSKISKPRSAFPTTWLTRDTDPTTGEPLPTVDAWYSRPKRHEIGDRGAFWTDASPTGMVDHASRIAIDKVRGVVPDDGVQVIRVGPEHETRAVLQGDLTA